MPALTTGVATPGWVVVCADNSTGLVNLLIDCAAIPGGSGQVYSGEMQCSYCASAKSVFNAGLFQVSYIKCANF